MKKKKIAEKILIGFVIVGCIFLVANKLMGKEEQPEISVELHKASPAASPQQNDRQPAPTQTPVQSNNSKPSGGEIGKIQIEVLTEIHHMANTIIIPGDGKIDGTEPITQENIDKVRKIIDANKAECFYGGMYEILIATLDRWGKKDYSQAVEDHNYVWRQLGGDIGKAIKVKPQ